MDKIRELPHSTEAEQALIGATLIEDKGIALSPADFYQPEHQKIWATILNLRESGKPADFVLVADTLRKEGKLKEAGGLSYIKTLAEGVPTTENAEYYASVVKEKAVARELIKKGEELQRLGYQEELDKAKELAHDIEDIALFEKDDSFGELFDENFYKRVTNLKRWYSKTLRRITNIIPFTRGEDIVIAGDTSHGKTQLALNLAFTFLEEGADVGYISLEMGKIQLAKRMVNWEYAGSETLLPVLDFAKPDIQGMLKALTDLEPYKSHFHFYERSRQYNDILRWIDAHHFDIVFIDYIQNISLDRPMREYEKISLIAKMIRTDVSKKRCTVVMSQLHRREDEEPTLNSLRGSGAIEESASSVILLWKDSENAVVTKYKIAKNQTTGVVSGWRRLKLQPNGAFVEL
jgi:replicative DNA helicase